MVYIHSSGSRSTSPYNSFAYVGRPGVPRYRINQAVPLTSITSYDYSSLPSATGYSATLSRDPPDVDSDATTSQRVVLSSDVSTVSLIQITAMPAATTSSQVILPKLPYHHVVNILYLVPLFVAAGVALGSITAVILLKLRKNRRPLLRASTLLPGPPYVPPDKDVEDRVIVHGPPSMESVSLFAAGTPSKATVHGSRYIPKRTLAWQLRRATQPTYTHTIIPSGDGEKFTVITQEDPFLVTSPIVRPSPSEDMSLPKVHVSPSSLEPTSEDNARVHRSQDNGLPKPFRRSMFDIIKFKGAYRSVHQEYAALMPVAEPVDKSPTNQVHRSSGSKVMQITSPGLNGKAHHSPDHHLHSSTMEDAHDLLVFKNEAQNHSGVLRKQTLLLETGALIPPTDRSKRKPCNVTPFASERTGSPTSAMFHRGELIDTREDEMEEENRDIYTKAPQRTPRKIVSASDTSRRFSAPDTHASILPLSPPALMSPPLEKSLFFTSSLSSGASLAGGMNAHPVTSSPTPPRVDRTPEFYLYPSPSKRSKAKQKLLTNQPEIPLPYPSYPAHIHAQHTPRRTFSTAEPKRRSVSPGSPEPKGHSTSAAYREGATGISFLGSLSPTTLAIALASSSSSDVLNKVNDIVAEGYTKRRTSLGGGSGSVAAGLPNSN